VNALICLMTIALSTLSLSSIAREQRDQQVAFPAGSSSTRLQGHISGYQTVNYKLIAARGQTMSAALTSDNASGYFNLYPPGKGPGDEAIFIGPMAGNRFHDKLPADGEYTLQLFLMRNAARRNEQANYQLEISITGEAIPVRTLSGLVAVPHTAWPADTDASGTLPCSGGEPGFERDCEFRVKRNRSGASIWTLKPGSCSSLRILYFDNQTFSTDDDTALSFARQGDNWWVGAGEGEFYLIPDAVIFGG